MCAGTRDDGSVIGPNDPQWDTLTKAAQAARTDPSVWLAQAQYYHDLADNAVFADAFCDWLDHIWTHGAEATLDRYLSDNA